MTEKLEYVRLKKYDGRLYRVREQRNGVLEVIVVDGPDLWSAKRVNTMDVNWVDAYDIFGSVSPAD